MIDFAGSGVVHLTGGTTAIVAAVILGPRIGRFKDEHGVKLVSPNNMPAHSVILQVLGTFILWFGWYGFNPGSTLIQSTASSSYVAALAAVNTTLSAASGALASFALRWALSDSGLLDVTALTNGALSGLVAITAGCAVVWPWAAVVIGMFGGFLYIGFRYDATILALRTTSNNNHYILVARPNGLFQFVALLLRSPLLALRTFKTYTNSSLRSSQQPPDQAQDRRRRRRHPRPLREWNLGMHIGRIVREQHARPEGLQLPHKLVRGLVLRVVCRL